MQYFLKTVIGFAAGVLGGMGMGGGTVLIPLLVIFCGVSQHIAQSVNLTAFIPMCVVSLIIHFKNKLIDIKSALLIGVPASVLGVLGSLLALRVDAGSLRLYFGIFLLLLGIYQLIQAIYMIRNEKKRRKQAPQSANKPQ